MVMANAGKKPAKEAGGDQQAVCQAIAQIGIRDLLRRIDESFQVSNDKRKAVIHVMSPQRVDGGGGNTNRCFSG
jgi:hypothetical protein